MSRDELKDFLDAKSEQFNHPDFIADDPIQIPHGFSKKEDIEISGLLAASIAWGQRKTIISNAKRMVDLMENEPFHFVMNASKNELQTLENFKHRTFNGTDLQFFVLGLRNIYLKGGLEKSFSNCESAFEAINQFRAMMMLTPHEIRSEKHISSPAKGSAAKRLNMFLRWMNRKDTCGVDFGIWEALPPSKLMIPLDIHTGNMARKLGILNRKQNDWRALEEIMSVLRMFDPNDPSKYDFALFGLGVNEEF
ncbi:MAG: TIGR02757 family protein [Crocinitomicaceae bacterium]|nr:TIGR02757 family protein [Crocinitomicaceae bacterium]